MTAPVLPRAVGTPLERVEAREKVTGRARYAYEHQGEGMAYCHPVQSTIASGEVRGVDTAEALSRDGVLAVIWAENAPALADTGDAELAAADPLPGNAFKVPLARNVLVSTLAEVCA